MRRGPRCVGGWCGPMLRTNWGESRKVESGIRSSLAAFDLQVFLHPAHILLDYSVILAQGIALPFLGHQNPAHVRMTREFDSKHVEDFALHPVGRQIHYLRSLRLVAV